MNLSSKISSAAFDTASVHQCGAVDISSFRELRYAMPFHNFSIKYVREGCEKYMVNGNLYHVQNGEYLLANHHAEGWVEISSPTLVQGICIDLSPQILSEVLASIIRPDTPYPDVNLDTFFCSEEFLENKYNAARTHLGAFLLAFDKEIGSEQGERYLPPEFYYTLAENILADHVSVCAQLHSIKTLKASTKKELLRRLQRGKEFIDTGFTSAADIKTIAKESSLSEYYFFRLFKAVYGISPHQYIVQKRLGYAKAKISQGSASISEIAVESGFSGVHAFSKSFKKHFGISPTAYAIAQGGLKFQP